MANGKIVWQGYSHRINGSARVVAFPDYLVAEMATATDATGQSVWRPFENAAEEAIVLATAAYFAATKRKDRNAR